VDDWPRGFDSIPCQRSALSPGADALSGGISDDPFRSSSRVGSPYQSFTCMKYTKVLWLSPLGDYLHQYPCDFKSEPPLRHGVSTQIVRKEVEISRMEDVDHLPS